MNDLAELALDGLFAARRAIAARPAPLLAGAGFVAASAVVALGARIGAAPAAVPIDRWLGLLPEAGYEVKGVVLGLGLLGAIVALLAVWLITWLVAARRELSLRHLIAIAATWAVPFALGPPLFSTGVFGYVAHGLLSRVGLDPYVATPSKLGQIRVVDAIDPVWRGAQSSDGPLATLLGHLVVTACGGSTIAAVLVFRLLAIGSAVVIGRCAAELAGPAARQALCVTVLNPAVLIFVVSAALWVGPMCALLLAALLAARRRHWTQAAGVLALAAAINPVALVAVPVLLSYRALGWPVRDAARVLARDIVVVVVLFATCTVSVPRGLGWLQNVGDAFHEHLPYTPSNLLGTLIGVVVPAAYDDVQTGARLATATAGVLVVCWLLVTLRNRPLEHTLGLAMVTAAVVAPVLYPQYLLWGLACLAACVATPGLRPGLIALSCVACTVDPQGLGERGGQVAGFAALAVVAAGLGGWHAWQLRSARPGRDPGAARRDGGHVARAWPFRTPHRRDVDAAHDDLQHGLRLHHREGGA
jgi:hypothetical protein